MFHTFLVFHTNVNLFGILLNDQKVFGNVYFFLFMNILTEGHC